MDEKEAEARPVMGTIFLVSLHVPCTIVFTIHKLGHTSTPFFPPT